MTSKTLFRRDVPLRMVHTVDMTLRLRVVAPEDEPVEKVLQRQKYEITPSGSDGFVVEAAIARIKVLGTSQAALGALPKRRGRPPKALAIGGAAPAGRRGRRKRRGRPKGSKNRPKTAAAKPAESQSQSAE